MGEQMLRLLPVRDKRTGAVDEVFSIGTTFATIGLLWGVIVGIILINIGARRGWLASYGVLAIFKWCAANVRSWLPLLIST